MTKKERTVKVIEYFRERPGEFYMLKGLLCATHSTQEKSIYDTMMIAVRMDELSGLL